jgi:GT2 family glycosyltransferase
MNKIKLSIVIVSYNTKDVLRDCLSSLDAVKDEVLFEIIVVDNASEDGSVEMLGSSFPSVKLIRNEKNVGFAAANNKARDYCNGEYILFLNSDTTVPKGTLYETVKYLDENQDVGSVTCKLVLPSGELDRDARRSFITPWIGLTHLFLKLDRLFPKSKLFGKYWYGYISPDTTHEVDTIEGAYHLTRKKVFDEVGWFDEKYFLDGEDLDLCYRIHEKGWKIIYYPKVQTIHIKGASKGKEGILKQRISLKDKILFRTRGVDSMEIFYKKYLWQKYPLILNYTVILGIRVMKLLRIIKTVLLG